jgi:hypothetical protein
MCATLRRVMSFDMRFNPLPQLRPLSGSKERPAYCVRVVDEFQTVTANLFLCSQRKALKRSFQSKSGGPQIDLPNEMAENVE